jgi:hypothetical protein
MLSGGYKIVQSDEPSLFTQAIIAACLFGFGLFAILQNVGYLPAHWLSPNPDVPNGIYLMIGTILILGSGLLVGKLMKLKTWQMNSLGYSLFGLSWLVTHWLVFGSAGAECVFDVGGFSLSGWQICEGIAAVVLIAFDLLFVGIAVQWLVKLFRRRTN